MAQSFEESMPSYTLKVIESLKEIDIDYQKCLQVLEDFIPSITAGCGTTAGSGGSSKPQNVSQNKSLATLATVEKVNQILTSTTAKAQKKFQQSQQLERYLKNKVLLLNVDTSVVPVSTWKRQLDEQLLSAVLPITPTRPEEASPAKKGRRSKGRKPRSSLSTTSTAAKTTTSAPGETPNAESCSSANTTPARRGRPPKVIQPAQPTLPSGNSCSSESMSNFNAGKNEFVTTTVTSPTYTSITSTGITGDNYKFEKFVIKESRVDNDQPQHYPGVMKRHQQSPPSNDKEDELSIKRKPYKKRKVFTASQDDDSNVGSDSVDLEQDYDEPKYCFCNETSYGEMVGCDNDLCPLEWFHFSCVGLMSKPRGKWYCPRCRGDRPNVMKPKEVIIQELEQYNREKED